jgi:hypothetical protein
MKKLVIVAALLVALAMALGACGETHKATYAWIFLDGKTIVEGWVDRLCSYRNGVLEIDIDGQRYATHYSNAVIVEYPEGREEKKAEVRPC